MPEVPFGIDPNSPFFFVGGIARRANRGGICILRKGVIGGNPFSIFERDFSCVTAATLTYFVILASAHTLFAKGYDLNGILFLKVGGKQDPCEFG